jgi:hypothetical protein
VTTGVLFGIAPAVMASGSSPIEAMRGAGRTTADRGAWIRRTLVGVQVALSLVLLTSAGLLARSLSELQAQDFGFRIDQRYIVDIVPSFGAAPASDLEAAYRRIPRYRQCGHVALRAPVGRQLVLAHHG